MARLWLSTKNIGIIISAVVLILSSAKAETKEYRAWTGEFMRMGAGARAMGMGNAYTAIEGDIYSSYFNPAGLAAMEERQVTYSFRYLTMDRMFRYFAFGSPAGPDANFAMSWMNAGTEDIMGRDLNGNPTGTLSDKRNAFTMTFSKYISESISIGLNTKYGLWKLAGEDAKSFGFDVGVIVRPFKNCTASFVRRDIRSRFTWKSERWKEYISGADGQTIEKEDKFPVYYTAGLAYKAFKEKLILSSTVEIIEDYPPGLDIGISYVYNKSFTLRTGVYNYNSSDELDSGSFTAGFTLRVTASVNFDYAYTTDNIDDDSIHIIGLVMSYEE